MDCFLLYLIEPRMMPLTTQRWAMRKATRVGSKAMRYDAKATLKLVVNWLWNRYWVTGRVWYFGFAVISCGIMKSFQDCRKAKMPTVAGIGASSGRTTLRYTVNVLAPSIRALSSSSSGMDRMKAEKSSTLKASW